MKERATGVFIGLFSWVLFSAQFPPNGGFEEWHTSPAPIPRPTDWNFVFESPMCSDMQTNTTETSDSFAGNSAALLESISCFNGGAQLLVPGLLHTGNMGTWPPYINSLGTTERPEQLSFYHKYEPIGGDTAIVEVMLFTFDTLEYEMGDTIAYALGYIFEEQSEYVEFILPLDYWSAEEASFFRVLFYTSKSQFETSNFAPPGIHGHEGTRLLIDKVEFQGGTLGISESSSSSFSIRPNPASAHLVIDIENWSEVERIEISDALGRTTSLPITSPEIDISDLKAGIYTLRIMQGDMMDSGQFVVR